MSLLLFFISSAFAVDCAVTKCNPCLSSLVEVDFTFVLDSSVSMLPEIRAVGSGLETLVSEATARDIDGRYTVIYGSFGPTAWPPPLPWDDKCGEWPHEILADATTNVTDLLYIFNTVKAINNQEEPGLHTKHGVWETNIEMALMSQGLAGYPTPADGYNLFNSERPWLKPLAPLAPTRRPTARKFLILVGDEDEDTPKYVQNRWPNMTCGEEFAAGNWFLPEKKPYRDFIKAAAARLASIDAIVYMFVKPNNGKTKMQYGNPDCDRHAPDYSQFDANATLDCLIANQEDGSVQGELLKAGKTARVFNQALLESAATAPEFVQQIMRLAIDEVSSCTARKKRDVEATEATCFQWRCDETIGCYQQALCSIGCTNCLINGTCVADNAPVSAGSCEFCRYDVSPDMPTSCSGSPTTCTENQCDAAAGTCAWNATLCTGACNRCLVGGGSGGGTCYEADVGGFPLPPTAPPTCERCAPSISDMQFSAFCTCEPPCAAPYGVCVESDNETAWEAAVGVCYCIDAARGGPTCSQVVCKGELCAASFNACDAATGECSLLAETSSSGGDAPSVPLIILLVLAILILLSASLWGAAMLVMRRRRRTRASTIMHGGKSEAQAYNSLGGSRTGSQVYAASDSMNRSRVGSRRASRAADYFRGERRPTVTISDARRRSSQAFSGIHESQPPAAARRHRTITRNENTYASAIDRI